MVGGISDYSFGLASGLSANQHDVIVLAIFAKAVKNKIERPTLNFRVIEIFVSSALPIRIAQIIWAAHRILAQNKVHQVISTIWFPCGLTAFLLKPFYRFKHLPCLHGADVLRASLKFKAKPLIRRIAQKADAVMVNSRFTKSMVMSLLSLPPKLVQVVNPGLNPQKYQSPNLSQPLETAQIHELEKLCLNKIVLLTVARFTPSKGHAQMISALPVLCAKHPQLIYLIVGSSPPMISTKPALVQQIESLNLTQVVHIFDDVSTHFIQHALELCSVFVMLSQEVPEDGYCEGFGIVFLEAGFFAKPVIGSRSGGVPDAIVDGQSGFLVDPENQAEVIAKVNLLVQNPGLAAEMGAFGRKRVHDHFFWEKIVAGHGELFK